MGLWDDIYDPRKDFRARQNTGGFTEERGISDIPIQPLRSSDDGETDAEKAKRDALNAKSNKEKFTDRIAAWKKAKEDRKAKKEEEKSERQETEQDQSILERYRENQKSKSDRRDGESDRPKTSMERFAANNERKKIATEEQEKIDKASKEIRDKANETPPHEETHGKNGEEGGETPNTDPVVSMAQESMEETLSDHETRISDHESDYP